MLTANQFLLPEHPDTSKLLLLEGADTVDIAAYARSIRKLRTKSALEIHLDQNEPLDDDYQKALVKDDEKDSIKDDLDDEMGSVKDNPDGLEPVKDDGDDSTDDDDQSDSEQEGEDEDGDDRQWKDLATGKFMRLCGSINIVTYGQSHSAVSITTLEPGYYKYWPIMQPFLLPLYVLTEMLCQLATQLASKFELAEDLKQAIESDSTVQGVLEALDEHKVAFRRKWYLLRSQRSNSLTRNRS